MHGRNGCGQGSGREVQVVGEPGIFLRSLKPVALGLSGTHQVQTCPAFDHHEFCAASCRMTGRHTANFNDEAVARLLGAGALS